MYYAYIHIIIIKSKLKKRSKPSCSLLALYSNYILCIIFLNQKCNVTFQKDIYLYYNILLRCLDILLMQIFFQIEFIKKMCIKI